MVTDPSTAFLMYEKQQIDWAGDPFCKFSSEKIFHLQKKGQLKKQRGDRAMWLYLNTQDPHLVSAKIRHALSLSIDRSLIVEHIYPCCIPLYQPLPLSLSHCPNTLSDNLLAQAK